MCLSCMADAQLVFKNDRPILPQTEHGGPFYLLRARTGCKEWPKDWYGLVISNGPLLIWEWEPQPEPPEESEEWETWFGHVSDLLDVFEMDPLNGHEFVSSCMAAGYNKEKHGSVVYWFANYVAKALREWDLATDKDWGPPVFPPPKENSDGETDKRL